MLNSDFSSQNIHEMLQQALAHHQAGQLDVADQLYRHILALDPTHPDALHFSGLLAHQTGQPEKAEQLIRNAISRIPQNPVYRKNLTLILKEQGRFSEAISCCRQFLAMVPDHPDILICLGDVFTANSQSGQALEAYQRALEFVSDPIPILYKMGDIFKELGHPHQAIQCYRNILRRRPDQRPAYDELSTLLRDLRLTNDTLDCLRQWMAQFPDDEEAYFRMGVVLSEQDRWNETFELFTKALQLPGKNPASYNRMGNICAGQGNSDLAIACYRKALAMDPTFVSAWNNLGVAWSDLGQITDATECFRNALNLDPANPEVFSNLLFSLQYSDNPDPDWLFAQHKKWLTTLDPDIEPPVHVNDPNPKRPLRIGYVSPDFKDHSCAFFIEPLIQAHDPQQVTVICYADNPTPDAVTQRIRQRVDDFVVIAGKPDSIVAEKIRQDRIDILIDLAGHTAGNRLPVFARKPAPIQVTWLGYDGTTGLNTMDYRISDHWLTPPDTSERFSEALYVLTRGSHAYLPSGETPQVSPAPCLNSGTVAFGSFNNLSKAGDATLDLWAEVLKTFPDSMLVIKAKQCRSRTARQKFVDRLAARGIAPDRIRLLSYASSYAAHLACYSQVDICLDTFPYNGVTTTCEALWMGVPVVSLCGSRSISRNGLSLLSSAGLGQWVAQDRAQFLEIVRDLVSNPDELAKIRMHMRQRLIQSQLCDVKGFARAMEQAYRTMWRQWCEQTQQNSGHGPASMSANQWFLSGIRYRQQNAIQQAIACYERAVALNPEFAEAYNNLGNALKEVNRMSEAISCYQRALALRPDFTEPCNNLANTYQALGEPETALKWYGQALKRNPDFVNAHNNLGVLLHELGHKDQAISHFHRAIAIRPDYAEAYNNLGNLFKDLQRYEEAVRTFQRALEIRANYPEAWNNMGAVFKEQGNLAEARNCFRNALALDPNYDKAHSNLLFSLLYDTLDTDEIYTRHRQWNHQHVRPLATARFVPANDPDPDRKLRVGYVSPDFRQHSCIFFIEPLLRNHDRNQVAVFCYGEVFRSDARTQRIRDLADVYRTTCGKSHDQVARQIREDQIDILVDLAGHSANNRLLTFAYRPAPVQVTWLGYNATTGMDTMDYRITDPWLTPPDTGERFSESLVALDRCSHAYQPPENAPAVSPPPVLTHQVVTFGSFNNLTKVSDQTLTMWAEILTQVTTSRLMLKAMQLADTSSRDRFLSRLDRLGIPPHRVIILPYADTISQALSEYANVDICLDTYPYNGVTTTCEALWMGVPVVTLAGQSSVSRVGMSLLNAAGFGQWVANSPSAYVAIACQLAADWQQLAMVRSRMRQKLTRSQLLDARGFAGSLEKAYRRMWRQWCRSIRSSRDGNGKQNV